MWCGVQRLWLVRLVKVETRAHQSLVQDSPGLPSRLQTMGMKDQWDMCSDSSPYIQKTRQAMVCLGIRKHYDSS